MNKLVLADPDSFARVDPIVTTLGRENNGQGVGVRTPTKSSFFRHKDSLKI